MTPREFVVRVKKQQGGLLLDTNVLLLYLMCAAERDAYAGWKRTSQFKQEHVEYLALAVRSTNRLVTTPHILAEVSNLSEKVPADVRDRYFAAMRRFVIDARERSPRAKTLVDDHAFKFLGLADLAQIALSSFGRPLVMTVDGPLTLELERRELPVVNLNHCIEGWTST